MNLAEELKPYLDAAFSAIWLRSAEPEEAQREILALCSEEGYEAVAWDCARGLQWPLENDKPGSQQPNPLEPLNLPRDTHDTPRLVILHNYHRFFSNPVVVQALLNAALAGKGLRVFYLVLAPVVQLPVELEKTFLLLEHRLPDAVQLKQIAAGVYEDAEAGPEVLEAALGLTRREAEDAFSLSLVKHDALTAEEVWELKAQSVRKKRFMEFSRPIRGFDSLGGLAALKEFSQRLLEPENTVPRKGLLLLGPPGCGKSAFARALCHETKMPLLTLDVAGLFAKHVGETEENVRDALATADAMGRCIMFVD